MVFVSKTIEDQDEEENEDATGTNISNISYIRNRNKNSPALMIPNCKFTKPIPYTFTEDQGNYASASSSSKHATIQNPACAMNAIGQNKLKQWDALLSIRYYNIVHRQVSSSSSSGKSNQQLLEIKTTVTTVADLQIIITPTAKPFKTMSTSTSSNHHRHQRQHQQQQQEQKQCQTQYNHSITLFAKSFTSEYDTQHKNALQTIQQQQHLIENPMYTFNNRNNRNNNNNGFFIKPLIIFSSNDDKYISCVIPHPIPTTRMPMSMSIHTSSATKPCSLSSIVIFSLDWKNKRNGSSKKTTTTTTTSSSATSTSTTTTTTTTSTNTTNNTNSSNKSTFNGRKQVPLPPYIQSIDHGRIHMNDNMKNNEASVSSSTTETINHNNQQNTASSYNTNSANTTSTATTTQQQQQQKQQQRCSFLPTPTRPPKIHNPRTVSIDTIDCILEEEQNQEEYHKACMLLSQITTLCDIHVGNGVLHPLLLAGCTNGSILLIGYKRAKLLTLLHDGKEEGEDEYQNQLQTKRRRRQLGINWNANENSIHHMIYMISPLASSSASKQQKHGNKQYSSFHGRLIVIQRNGQTIFYDTEFHSTSQSTRRSSVSMTTIPMHPITIVPSSTLAFSPTDNDDNEEDDDNYSTFLPLFAHGIFLSYDIVAFLMHPFYTMDDTGNNDNNTIVQIWNVVDKIILNELKLNNERLIDFNHGFLPMKKKMKKKTMINSLGNITSNHDVVVIEDTTKTRQTVSMYHVMANFQLGYDEYTNSLIVSSAISSRDGSNSVLLRPFMTIWKWRTNVVGFTLLGESFMKYTPSAYNERCNEMNDWTMVENSNSCYSLQNVCLCRDMQHGYQLACIVENDHDMFEKELLSVGLLSPTGQRNICFKNEIRESCALFITHDAISYLDSLPVSTQYQNDSIYDI
jgi:hypothetical protein